MLGTDGALTDSTDFDKPDNLELRCEVCGDIATGRHYGTIACNGCKGFFRRTIRRSYKYTCRFNGNCSIDKHNRAVCRSCRYTRCLNAGMRIDERVLAVQNERDFIGKRQRAASMSSSPGQGGIAVSATKLNARRTSFPKQVSISSAGPNSPPTSPSPSTSWNNPKALLESLLASEKTVQRLRDTVIEQTSVLEFAKIEPLTQFGEGKRKATVNDIYISIHSQLLLVIEWAKTLPPFAALSTADQTALLKRFACQHVVLCVTYRSKDDIDVLKLLNNSCIPRVKSGGDQLYPERFYIRDCEKMMDELVAPMKFLKMDDVEFVAMKACILFNPVARGLSSESRNKILESRRQVFAALQYYIDTKIPSDANRLGDLMFFILSPLQTLANHVSEDILVSKLSGVARLDQLMEELILAETQSHHIENSSTESDHRQTCDELEDADLTHQPSTLADCMHYVSASHFPTSTTQHPIENRFNIETMINHFSPPPTSCDPCVLSEPELFCPCATSIPTTTSYQFFSGRSYNDSYNFPTTTASQY